MPPPIALLICSAFVLFLLRQEARASQDVSKATWIPTLWILMIASRSLGAWFGNTAGNDSGNSYDPIAPAVRLGWYLSSTRMAGGATGLHVSQHIVV